MALTGFFVIDVNGNLKITQSGAALPDPVTIPHGGTGLITCTQGDLLYASADGVLARLAKATGGVRILTNQGTSYAPIWTNPLGGSIPLIPRPTSRKSGWIEAIAASTTPGLVVLDSAVNASTSQNDTISNWLRYSTTNVSGNTIGFRSSSDIMWIDHGPILEATVRLPTSVASLRIWVVLSNVGAGYITNSDDQHLLKGVGFRFSAGTDTKWVPWTSDGTTQTIGTGIVAPVANTVYTLTCVVAAGGGSATFTINGDASTAQTVSIGAGALGTAMRINMQVTTTTTVIKDFDIAS